jgi:hypothetical protein
LADAPSAAEHTSHESAHAVSQQKPSTQLLASQTRQAATLQSWPAAVLHAAPFVLRRAHAPAAVQ